MAKVDVSYQVQPDQQKWLEDMAAAHNLPDADKALRCLLDFAMEDGDPKAIFETIRCRHC